jgi:hypothetical protein
MFRSSLLHQDNKKSIIINNRDSTFRHNRKIGATFYESLKQKFGTNGTGIEAGFSKYDEYNNRNYESVGRYIYFKVGPRYFEFIDDGEQTGISEDSNIKTFMKNSDIKKWVAYGLSLEKSRGTKEMLTVKLNEEKHKEFLKNITLEIWLDVYRYYILAVNSEGLKGESHDVDTNYYSDTSND